MYLFERKGQILFESELDEDSIMEIALDAEALGFEKIDNAYLIETDPKKWLDTVKILNDKGITDFISNEISRVPLTEIELSEEKAQKLESLVEDLEDIDDVSSVFTNAI